MIMRIILAGALLFGSCFLVAAQEPAAGSGERRVSLSETAVAFDGGGASALEATLKTTALNGAEDSPVTNVRFVVKNSSTVPYAFVSGLVTFYNGSGVRCGEGIFKADALVVGESFETDSPGIRIRCAPATWRIVANNLLPRIVPTISTNVAATGTAVNRSALNLVISVDGEEHPIQLDKPMVVKLGDVERTIVLREAP
jgi:hypothetical protein